MTWLMQILSWIPISDMAILNAVVFPVSDDPYATIFGHKLIDL